MYSATATFNASPDAVLAAAFYVFRNDYGKTPEQGPRGGWRRADRVALPQAADLVGCVPGDGFRPGINVSGLGYCCRDA
jgi:hypothetical protein